MKETLYTIPVNDAFAEDVECPICKMALDIENDAIEFTMGPSYMEDDIRANTDRTGFCRRHIIRLNEHGNRLGLALMLDTHLRYTMKQFDENKPANTKAPSLFKKSSGGDRLAWLKKINNSCYICDKVEATFNRYIATIYHLYKTDPDFSGKLKNCRGLCSEHYVLLYENASSYLSGSDYEEFIRIISDIYIENIRRVEGDLEWFIDKFDYRNADAPWKNSKDALPRTITKTNSIL